MKSNKTERNTIVGTEKDWRINKGLFFVLGVLFLTGALLVNLYLMDSSEVEVDMGYELSFKFDLDKIEGENQELCEFRVEEKEKVKILVNSRRITSDKFHLKLVNPKEGQTTLIKSDGYSGDLRITKGIELEQGEYRFILDTTNSSGKLNIYINKE